MAEPNMRTKPLGVAERYYAPLDIARLLDVNPQSVRVWIRDGRLRASRISRRIIRVSDSQLAEFMDGYVGKAKRAS